jgi:hypothetical protein
MWEYIHYSINLYTYTNIKHPKHIEVQRACINHLCLFLICQFKCKWTKYALQIKGFPCTLKKQHFNLKKISWIKWHNYNNIENCQRIIFTIKFSSNLHWQYLGYIQREKIWHIMYIYDVMLWSFTQVKAELSKSLSCLSDYRSGRCGQCVRLSNICRTYIFFTTSTELHIYWLNP